MFCDNRLQHLESTLQEFLPVAFPIRLNWHLDLSDGTAYNALTRDEDYIAEFIREFSDRMYFGTDLCSPDQNVPLIGKLKEWLDRGVITKTAYNQITHENAMRQLKL